MPIQIFRGVLTALIPAILIKLWLIQIEIIDFGILPDSIPDPILHTCITLGILMLVALICCDTYYRLYAFCITMTGILIAAYVGIGWAIVITLFLVYPIVCLSKTSWYMLTKENPFAG